MNKLAVLLCICFIMGCKGPTTVTVLDLSKGEPIEYPVLRVTVDMYTSKDSLLVEGKVYRDENFGTLYEGWTFQVFYNLDNNNSTGVFGGYDVVVGHRAYFANQFIMQQTTPPVYPDGWGMYVAGPFTFDIATDPQSYTKFLLTMPRSLLPSNKVPWLIEFYKDGASVYRKTGSVIPDTEMPA